MPTAGEIHVWRLEVSAAPVDDLFALLDPGERERAARFAFPRHRDEYVAVRGSLRRVLGRYLGRDPAHVRFTYSTHGKPALDGPQEADLRFNVSHSAGRALLAFASGADVGVDVEAVRERADLPGLSRTVFSPDERAALSGADPVAWIGLFHRLWSAKEAYIKGLGGGLGIPLQSFTIDVRDPDAIWPVVTDTPPAGGGTCVGCRCRRRTPAPWRLPLGRYSSGSSISATSSAAGRGAPRPHARLQRSSSGSPAVSLRWCATSTTKRCTEASAIRCPTTASIALPTAPSGGS